MNKREHIIYSIRQLIPYINWLYFYHAWQVIDSAEKKRLRQEAEEILFQLDKTYRVHALFLLADANSDGDDLLVQGVRLPLLRQQHTDSSKPCLCLSDFVRPLSQGESDVVGVFATTVDAGMESDFRHDDYMRMLVQLLADRLAEAAAEVMHLRVRTADWGYAPDEQLSIADLHAEKFQGIRPAVGYPSLPDTSINFILSQLLHFQDIGIRLTESGAMRPHASVSGLMLAHPASRYFSVGKIGEDQLHSYAKRRGIPMELVKTFLNASLFPDK